MSNAGVGVKVSTKDARRGLGNLLQSITNGAQRVVENVGAAAEKVARSTTTFKDRTGELRSSIEHTNNGVFSVRLRAMAPHGIFVEAGTRAHVIRARRVAYLRFQVAGRWVSRKEVRHPGTKPTWFMRDTGLQMETIFHDRLESTTNTAIRRHNR